MGVQTTVVLAGLTETLTAVAKIAQNVHTFTLTGIFVSSYLYC